MDHLPCLPDLNPIENVWSLLKRRLAELPRKPTNKAKLFTVLQRLWGAIGQDKIDSCVDSMPKRLEAVRKVRGFVTKYYEERTIL